jgi:hypothetical protein
MIKKNLMKHKWNSYIPFLLLSSIGLLLSCDNEDEVTTSFERVSSTYEEINGTGEVIIPLRSTGSITADNITVQFDGTATEGEDFELVSINSESMVIRVIDDAKFEETEYVRVLLVSNGANVGGNAIHRLNIVSNCEDVGGLDVGFFAGDYDALEDYGGGTTYGPYTITLVQDEEDPTRFSFDNLYDSGCDAYMIFDFANGTVAFPNQSPCDSPLTNSSGTFNIDLCEETTLTINLNFDGGDWVYRFTKL